MIIDDTRQNIVYDKSIQNLIIILFSLLEKIPKIKNIKYTYIQSSIEYYRVLFSSNGKRSSVTNKKRHPLTGRSWTHRVTVDKWSSGGRGGSKSEFQTGIREYRGPSVGTNPEWKGSRSTRKGQQTCGMDGAHRKLFNRWLHPHDRPPASRLISS